MSQLILNAVGTPSSPAAGKGSIYYATAGPGAGSNIKALVAIDENGVVAHLAGFTILDYRLIKVTIITGSTSWTPQNGCRAAYVECWGAGGQGGGCATSSSTASVGGGGGGGAYAASFLTGAQIKNPTTYAVGAGGTGGGAGASGNAGGDTTWDTTVIVAKGGSGGAVMAAGSTFLLQAGAAGGAVASCTGDIKIQGSIGDDGVRISGTQAWSGRGGAASVIGVEGASRVIAVSGGTAGNAAQANSYGSGGGGAATLTTQLAGGNGAPGIIRVWEFA